MFQILPEVKTVPMEEKSKPITMPYIKLVVLNRKKKRKRSKKQDKRPPMPEGLRVKVYSKTCRRCWYCGAWANSIDHFFPRSRHQEIEYFALWNLVPCCKDCNVGKGAKEAHEWKDPNTYYVRQFHLEDPQLNIRPKNREFITHPIYGIIAVDFDYGGEEHR